MHSFLAFFALFTLSSGAPTPQDIDFAGVDALPDPTYTVISGLESQAVTYDPTAAVAAAAAEITAEPLPQKRSPTAISARSACDPQPASVNVYNVQLGSIIGFRNDATIASLANSASTPAGYNNTFKNLGGSNNANGYLGYTVISSYNPSTCATECNSKAGCIAFNIYFERDPLLEPGSGCTNPGTTVNIKCAYWGGPVTSETAVNRGQMRSSFEVAIAGSNGYTSTSYQTADGYTGPTYLATAAINAPLDCNGKDTYMGYKLFSDGSPFDVKKCAAACTAQTEYNARHPPTDGTSPRACNFFNTYLLSKNGVNQGQYCSMYTEAWASSYATNTGQTRGRDVYTILYSFSFYNSTSPGHGLCPADISYLQINGADFCTAFIGYIPPKTTTNVVQTATMALTSNATTTIINTPATSTVLSTMTFSVTATSSAMSTVTTVTTVTQAANKRRDNTDPADFSVLVKTITTDRVPAPTAPSNLTFTTTTDIFSQVATSSSDALKKRTITTPALITSWPSTRISSACAKIATGTSTVTSTTSISTVFSTTIIIFHNSTSTAPVPLTTMIYTTTVGSTATLSSTTTVTSTTTVAPAGPTDIFGDQTNGAPSSLTNGQAQLELPFTICPFGVCTMSLYVDFDGWTASPGTAYLLAYQGKYNPNFFGIYKGEKQGMAYKIGGAVGSRTLTVDYKLSSAQDSSQYYHFDVTYHEAQSGLIQVNYHSISDNGSSGWAWCYLSGNSPGTTFTQIQTYSYYEPGKLYSGLSLRWDTVAKTMVKGTIF